MLWQLVSAGATKSHEPIVSFGQVAQFAVWGLFEVETALKSVDKVILAK